MSAASKMLENLKTPEGQKRIEEHIKKYLEEQKIKEEKVKNIMSTTDYIEWFEKFTKDKGSFANIDYTYCSEQLEDIDRKNLDDLYLFYDGIEKFASANHIVPNYFDFGEFYKVKYNDFYFKIGIAYGQGNSIFYSRVTGKNLKGFINFNSILTNNHLNKLSSLIMTMIKSGIPTEDIINTVNATISHNKKRVLTKQK